MNEGKWDICWSSRAQWKASLLQTALKNRVPACSRPHYDCRIKPNGVQMHLSHRLCFQRFLVPLRLDRDPNRYFSTRLIWHFRSSLFIGPGVHTQIIAFWIGSYWECVCSDWGLPPSVGSLIVFLIGHHMAFQCIPEAKKWRELGTRQWKCVIHGMRLSAAGITSLIHTEQMCHAYVARFKACRKHAKKNWSKKSSIVWSHYDYLNDVLLTRFGRSTIR